MKTCPDCGERKLSRFNRDNSRADGLACYCRSCARSHQRRWRNAHLARHKRRQFKRHLRTRYNLTYQQYEQLCKLFPVCPLCRTPEKLEIDHDHVTGKVRGRLCCSCNTALGRLGDNIKGLKKAITYLSHEVIL
jgi:hypothetical protein